MKKIFITASLLCSLLFAKSIYANPYQPGSQSWHNWNGMMQAEIDKQKRERQQQGGYQSPPIRTDTRSHYDVFVYHENTGEWLRQERVLKTTGDAVYRAAKSEFKRKYGKDATNGFVWLSNDLPFVRMLKDQRGKWFAYQTTKSKERENFIAYCQTQNLDCRYPLDGYQKLSGYGNKNFKLFVTNNQTGAYALYYVPNVINSDAAVKMAEQRMIKEGKNPEQFVVSEIWEGNNNLHIFFGKTKYGEWIKRSEWSSGESFEKFRNHYDDLFKKNSSGYYEYVDGFYLKNCCSVDSNGKLIENKVRP